MWCGCSCSSRFIGGVADPIVQQQPQPVSSLGVALSHRCPACGAGKLYRNVLNLHERCSACGLDFTKHDVGDGPAFFAITLLGFVVVGLALGLEVWVRPPYWVHGVSVLLSLLILTPLSLRFFKSYLIALKYKHHWSQGIE